MRLEFAGTITFVSGLFMLGMISVTSAEFIPKLQPIPEVFEMRGATARLNGILIAALSAAIFAKRLQGPAAALLAAYLSTWLFVIQLPLLCFEPFDITRLVSLLELAAVVAALIIVAFGKDSRSTTPARIGSIVYGSMLLLFGMVHFQHHDFVASMIPAWVPFAALWPWFTASANLVAGLSFLTGIKVQIGGALLGAMYASWVPIVHLPRVLAAPEDVIEWTAAAVAVTLAGAAWLVAGSNRETKIEPAAAIALD
jgi:uncharacterized membrane protein